MDVLKRKIWDNISISKFNQLLPLFGIMVLVAGYLYTDIIYRHFGIQHWLYFNIEDYLTASLGRMINIILSSVFFSVSFMLFFDGRKKLHITGWLLIIIANAVIILYYFCTGGIGNTIWTASIIILATSAFIAAMMYPNERIPKDETLIAFLVVTVSFICIFLEAENSIRNIETPQSKFHTKVEMELDADKYGGRNFVILGTNSRYFFLRDDCGKIEIVQTGNIMRKGISYSRK